MHVTMATGSITLVYYCMHAHAHYIHTFGMYAGINFETFLFFYECKFS